MGKQTQLRNDLRREGWWEYCRIRGLDPYDHTLNTYLPKGNIMMDKGYAKDREEVAIKKDGPYAGESEKWVKRGPNFGSPSIAGDLPDDSSVPMGSHAKASDLPDLSPDAELCTNEFGGSQSSLDVDFTLIEPKALFNLARTLQSGRKKYGLNNWRLILSQEHLNHALTHIYAYLAGDKQDNHLDHAFCRLMMAIAMDGIDEPTGK